MTMAPRRRFKKATSKEREKQLYEAVSLNLIGKTREELECLNIHSDAELYCSNKEPFSAVV